MKGESELLGEEDVSGIVVLIDLNPLIWEEHKKNDFTLAQMLDQLLVFIKSYLLLNRFNHFGAVGYDQDQSIFLVTNFEQHGISYEDTSKQLRHNLGTFVDNRINISPSQPPKLSSALLMELCYINQIVVKHNDIKPRVLILSSSPDPALQYIPIMNAIFAAKKKNIPIDGCVLASIESPLLQQASYLTGGVYLRVQHPKFLLHYLLSVFLCDRYSRQYLPMPSQSNINFTASCFCHKKSIEEGFVCSYCLSIFCNKPDQCKICEMNQIHDQK